MKLIAPWLARWTFCLLLLVTVFLPQAQAVDDFVSSGALASARHYHTATQLANGMLLVVGGYGDSGNLSSAELYDPASGLWSTTGSLGNARYQHTATLLADGRVLVAGGSGSLSSAELYDPATGLWSTTGPLATGRDRHTATLLSNGMVLVAGGYNGGYSGGYLSSAELYDPATGLWSATGSLATARYQHTATLLANGKVLVAAGYGYGYYGYQASVLSAELYDPATGLWSATGSLATGRSAHTATLLANGKVFVVGGDYYSPYYPYYYYYYPYSYHSFLASAELYDPATGQWSATGSLATSRYRHTATLLANGKLLVAGGYNNNNGYLSSAELYDPADGQWSTTGSLATTREYHTATLLADGKLLVAGGYGNNGNLSSAELYTPAPLAWALFSAAESALPVADLGLVNLSPIDQFSVVKGSAAHSGVNALKFQTVDDGSTFVERTIVGPSLVSFSWRVSSEQDFDLFSYRVDGSVRETLSGNGAWLNRALTLGPGTHTIRWTYSKDESDGNFDDAGYLDDLVIVDAYTNLEVTAAGSVVTGSGTLDFGTVRDASAEVTRSLTFKNTGTISQNVVASLPADGGFVFGSGLQTASLTLNAGQQSTLVLKMPTVVAARKSALLSITASGSRTPPPAITLVGEVEARAPDIVCSWSGGAISSGQGTALDFGTTPAELTITVNNMGDAALAIAAVSVAPAANFQVLSQPAATVEVGGSTTFALRALDANCGLHQATVTIANNDADTPNFTFPLASKSYLAVAGTGYASGSFSNSGTTLGWDLVTTPLAGGGSGQAIQAGSTPNNGNSTIGATFDGPGLLSWNWKVSAQQGFDWLLCEVNGVESAGISTKTAAWQSQVLHIPAGAQVRWIYRKDATNQAGTDTGFLSNIRFSKFTAAQTSFNDWTTPRGDLSPTQTIPAGGGMQAMFAWLGGVDPAAGPSVGHFQPVVSGGFYKYRYTVGKAAAGIVQPQISTDLVTWSSRRMKQTLISEDDSSAVIELSVAATGKVFSRFATEPPAYVSEGFARIPAGSFTMGDAIDGGGDAHTVDVSEFYLAKNLVTWAGWDKVRSWAINNGYPDLVAGSGKGSTHPVQSISWYQMVKYCNARSQQEGLTPVYYTDDAQTTVYQTGDLGLSNTQVDWAANGYRLPTEAEWEKAARGGLSGKRFPWGDTISQSQANYYASSSYSYDLSGAVNNYHPTYATGSIPYTSPVGSFAANGYGLYDMAGNVWQLCWDWYGTYDTGTPLDPRGVSSGSGRVGRGGSWGDIAFYCRVAGRYLYYPSYSLNGIGFRVARSSVP